MKRSKSLAAAVSLALLPAALSIAPALAGSEALRDPAATSRRSASAARSNSVIEADSSIADSASVAIQRPNTLSIELLGRGLLYSINYDHTMNSWLGIGGGFSYIGLTIGTTSISGLILPLYSNFYFGGDSSRGFGTVGATVILASATSTPTVYNYNSNGTLTSTTTTSGPESGSGVGVMPTIGGGYEFRGHEGFLFRAAPYIAFIGGKVQPWFGLSAGAAF